LIIVLSAVLLMVNGAFYATAADHDEDNGENNLMMVTNTTYWENCGACHFAYQPELLPSGSWDKIFAALQDHFGEMVDLDPESKKIIAAYLKANAAECSSEEQIQGKRSKRGMCDKRTYPKNPILSLAP
jgi:hypothetical protein